MAKLYKIDANTILNSYFLHCEQIKRLLKLGAFDGFEKHCIITALNSPKIEDINRIEYSKLPPQIVSFMELTKIVVSEGLV